MEENNMNNVYENSTGEPVGENVGTGVEQHRPYYEVQNGSPDYTNDYQQAAPVEGGQPGKGQAVASLVLGIVSIVFWFFGAGAFVGVVTGIVGLICSSSAKKQGFVGGIRTAGFVCSLVGLCGCGLVFVSCIACIGTAGAAGTTAGLLEGLENFY